jgi:hypothetical protein
MVHTDILTIDTSERNTGGAGASMTPTSMEVLPEQQNRPIRQRVKYSSPGAVQNAQPGAADI